MKTRKKFKVVTYQDKSDQYRWRLVAGNGKIISDSGEGYTSRHSARRGFVTVFKALRSGSVQFVEDGKVVAEIIT